MREYVIDASVAVKWYSSHKEQDVAEADKLLHVYEEGQCTFIAPTLIVYEVSNALRFNPFFGDGEVQDAMRNFFSLDMKLVDASEYMAVAIQIAFDRTLTIYDAVYAALSQVAGVPLITADYKFYSKAKNLPFIVALRDLNL
jgi:predicted nucleic acid-binding protein